MSTDSVDEGLYDAFGQRQVSTMYEGLNQYRVVMEVAPEYRQHPETLDTLYVPNSTDTPPPLSAIGDFGRSTAPLVVNHQSEFPAVTLSFNLIRGASLGDAVEAIERAARDIGLPASVHGGFQGTALAFQTSLASEPWLILAALSTMYIVLGILYESLVHPLTILSTLPSAGVGATLALIVTQDGLHRHCADRTHPPDWHRQEERDHDDRFLGWPPSGTRACRQRPPSGRRPFSASVRS